MENGKEIKILITEPDGYSEEALKILSSIGQVTSHAMTPDTLMKRVSEFHVLIVRLGLRIDKNVIVRGTNLRFIVSPTTGLDHIDMIEAEQRNIKVISLRGEVDFLRSVPSTAEYTWGLLISLTRNIPQSFEDVKSGLWNRDIHRGYNLKGKKLGILGLGRVGGQVMRYGEAFEMEIAAYDPYLDSWAAGILQKESIEALLTWSDIISIHVPFNESTKNLLNRDRLSFVKAGCFIINTSRAGVWDEEAVLDLLTEGRIKGVATDVVSDEHKINETHPMIAYARAHRNLIITPHLGGATFESMAMTEIFVANKLKQALEVCAQ